MVYTSFLYACKSWHLAKIILCVFTLQILCPPLLVGHDQVQEADWSYFVSTSAWVSSCLWLDVDASNYKNKWPCQPSLACSKSISAQSYNHPFFMMLFIRSANALCKGSSVWVMLIRTWFLGVSLYSLYWHIVCHGLSDRWFLVFRYLCADKNPRPFQGRSTDLRLRVWYAVRSKRWHDYNHLVSMDR